jgi:hypothetical protein
MQRNSLIVATAGLVLAGLSGSASAGITGLDNADFEDIVGNNGGDLAGWFESPSLFRESEGGNVPDDVDGSFFANFVGAGDAWIYQQFGTYTPGETGYTVTFTLGDRTNQRYDGLTVALYGGGTDPTSGDFITAATGAVELVTSAAVDPFGADDGNTGSFQGSQDAPLLADVSLDLDFSAMAGSLSAGDRLWLVFEEVAPSAGLSGRSDELLDDVSITLIPEPTSTLAAVAGLGLLAMRRRRR